MTTIELKSRVGPDGILTLNVPVGLAEANREVQVIVRSVEPRMTPEESRRFIERTAGSWQGEFERPEPGEFEVRDELP